MASQLVDLEKNKHLASKMDFLLTILKTREPLSTIEFGDDGNDEEYILRELITGYNILLAENYSSLIAYQSFSNALNRAHKIGNNDAVKFCITSILETLSKEIFIGSKQFQMYLNQYEKLIVNNDDRIIFAYYNVVFASKEDENLTTSKNLDNHMMVLGNLLSDKKDSYPLMPKYFYEKGTYHKLKGEHTKATEYFIKALDLCKFPHLKSLKNVLYWQLSHNFYLDNDIEESENFLKKSEKTSSGLRQIFYDYRLKAWILNAKKKHDSAYYYLNSSVELEYKMGAKNNSLETALLSIQNQTDKLKLDQIISENKRKSTQNWLIVVTLALVFGAGIAILVQKNTTKKRKLAEQETLLKQERVDNLLKQQELVSIDAMIEGQEKERQRVANELHDDLGSLMATIKLHFDNVKGKDKDPALKQAQTLLEEAYQKVRGIAHSKNSGVMSSQGLLPAVKKMAQVISETNALEVSVEDFGMGERMENSLELSLFRTIQELVANTIKHAEATKLNIQISQYEDNLNIIIEDNGKGFDRSNLDKSKTGMGLTNIEKRIEHLEGNFTIDSVLGKGTSIIIDIPV